MPDEPRRARRLIEAPEALRDARWSPSRTTLVVVVICVIAAVSVLGVRAILARDSAPSPRASGTSLTVAGQASVTGRPPTAGAGGSSAPTGNTAGSTSGTMRIHVVGAVRSPGVVSVPAGARVSDAVTAAGGLQGADATAINLARVLTDGEQIHVLRPGETPPPAAAGAGASPAATGAEGSASPSGGLVNLNTADLAALDTLPGVGPVTAQRILDWRTEHGRFSSVDELGEVSGIGDKALARLRAKATV